MGGPVHSPVVSRILEFFKGVLGRLAFFVFSCLTVFQASSGTTYVPIRFFFSSGRGEATDQHPLQSLSARVNTGELSEFWKVSGFVAGFVVTVLCLSRRIK